MTKLKATLNSTDLQLIEKLLQPQYQAMIKRFDDQKKRLDQLDKHIIEQAKRLETLKADTLKEIDKRFHQQFMDIDPLIDYHMGNAFDFHFKENMKLYPTKDDLYTKWDQVITELKAFREERLLITHQLSEQETRLLDLEDIHPNYQHP